MPENETMARSLAEKCNAELGEAVIRHFPDGESYIRILSDVQDKQLILVCTLSPPDDKIWPIIFFSRIARELGAKNICLFAPYLAYMRQDKRFQPGEGIAADYFSKLLSTFVDSIITVDPHLHRIKSLSDIYSVPAVVIHGSGLITEWIRSNIERPVFIGPNQESEQWVSAVAGEAGVPYLILRKTRKGDRDVEVFIPDVESYSGHTPVLVDDIISTASTMISTIRHLTAAGMQKPVCIGVHGIFAGDAYERLVAA